MFDKMLDPIRNVQLPASTRVETNNVGTSDIKMPMPDFLQFEKMLAKRCRRNMILAGGSGAALAVIATIYYLKKTGRLY